jgi:hypothetical protein
MANRQHQVIPVKSRWHNPKNGKKDLHKAIKSLCLQRPAARISFSIKKETNHLY